MKKIIVRQEETYAEIYYEGDSFTRVNLYKGLNWGNNNMLNRKWEINWSAFGNQSVEDTKEYIALMNKAVEVANKLNERDSK